MPKTKLKESDRANHNRAIVLLIGTLITSSWVMINAGEFLISGFLYIVMASVSVFLYLIWSRF